MLVISRRDKGIGSGCFRTPCEFPGVPKGIKIVERPLRLVSLAQGKPGLEPALFPVAGLLFLLPFTTFYSLLLIDLS